MTDAQMLATVRLVHTLIYVVNAGACFVVLYAGLAGDGGWILWVALALVGGEGAILVANRLRCPLSAIAVRYGARETDFLYDTFLPERLTRYTVHFFSAVVLLGLALIAIRGLGVVS
jgi:hypothetical protein